MHNPETILEPVEALLDLELTPEAACVIGSWEKMKASRVYEQPEGSFVCAADEEESPKMTCIECGKCSLHMVFEHDDEQLISARLTTTDGREIICPDYNS